MANQKITELTELTVVADDDTLAIVDDTTGTPVTKKIKKSNLVTDITATTQLDATGTPSSSTYLRGDNTWATVAAGGGASYTWKEDFNGSVSTGRLARLMVPDELNGKVIKEVRIGLNGLPTGSALKVDVRKNGTATTDSIFTADTEIEVGTAASATNGIYQSGCDTAGSTVGTAGTTLDSARDDVASDDVLNIYVTQIGSTIAGTDLIVQVIIG